MRSSDRDKMQTAIFDKYGCFFAFGDKQFASRRVEGVKYMSLGAGLICPSDSAKEFLEEFERANAELDLKVVAEHGKSKIICYELSNHEYSYTHDITDTVEAVRHYGITAEEVALIAPLYLKRNYAWEEREENGADEALERAYNEACLALESVVLGRSQ